MGFLHGQPPFDYEPALVGSLGSDPHERALQRFAAAAIRLDRLDEILGDNPAARNAKTAARAELSSALAVLEEFEVSYG